MKTEKIHPFIQQLRTDKRLLGKLKDVATGDWDHLLDVARQEGHRLDKDALMDLFPKGFYRGFGKHPELGWPLDHHKIDRDTSIQITMSWNTWNGRPLLAADMESVLKQSLDKAASNAGITFQEVKLTTEMVLLRISYPLRLNLQTALEACRMETSKALKRAFPELEKALGTKPLWSPNLGVHEMKPSQPPKPTTANPAHHVDHGAFP